MSANELQQSLLDSVQLLSKRAVQNADSAITIKATIKEVVDAGLGTYIIEYGGNSFEATALEKSTYQKNDVVYALVPNGDFAQQKIILCTVDPRVAAEVSTSDSENYFTISDNLFGNSFGVNLRSWVDEKNDITSKIDLSKFGIIFSEYLKTYKNFVFTAKVKTEIDKDHQVKGNYGLKLYLPFVHTAAAGEISHIEKEYVMDVNTMQGNPYAYEVTQLVNLYYEIDDSDVYDTTQLPRIEAFVSDFGYTEPRTVECDIHFTDIGLKIVDPLTDTQKDGYSLSIVASQGNFFLKDRHEDKKTLTLDLKLNGKDTSYEGWDCYWFVADSLINTTSDGYYPLGGLGWKCLNKKQNISYDETGKQSFQYVTNDYSYSVLAKELKFSLKYKCILTKGELVVQNEIIIKNLGVEIITELVTSTGLTQYTENIGNVNLIARIYYNGVTNNEDSEETISTAWQRFDKDDNYIDNNFYTIIRYNERVGDYLETEISFPCSKIEKQNIIRCTFYSDTVENGTTVNYNLGSASINLTTTKEENYRILISNGDVLYKYDADGDSPTVADYDGPASSKVTSIKPVSFTLYKPNGTELTESEYAYCKYTWSFPKNSMMTLVGYSSTQLAALPQDDEYYYISGYGKGDLNYGILSRYNKKKSNNTIILNIEFAKNKASSTANIKFVKDGESGTNGTKYSAVITYNDFAYGERDTNNKIRKLQLVYVAGTGAGWRLYDLDTLTLKQMQKPAEWPTLKVKIYADGEDITSSTGRYSVSWGMFDSATTNTSKTNNPCFNINSSSGQLSSKTTWGNADTIYTNIVRATITINDEKGGDSYQQVLYAYYPIEITRLISTKDHNIVPTLDGGFDTVLYSSDGLNPSYDNTNPFVCTDYYSINDESYYKYVWFVSSNLTCPSSGTRSKAIRPVSKFANGVSKNYVKVVLTMTDAQKKVIEDKIKDLKVDIEETQNKISYYTHNKQYVLDFVKNFDYNNYIQSLKTTNGLMLNRYNGLIAIDELFNILESLNSYCAKKKINVSDFKLDYSGKYGALSTAKNNLYGLIYINKLESLSNLSGQEIKNFDYNIIKNIYGVSIANKLKSLVQTWNNTIYNKYNKVYSKLTEQKNGKFVYQTQVDTIHTICTNLKSLSNDDSNLNKLVSKHDECDLEAKKFTNLKNSLIAVTNKLSDPSADTICYDAFDDGILKQIVYLLQIYQNTDYQTNYYNNLISSLNKKLDNYKTQLKSYQAKLLPNSSYSIVHIKPIVMIYNRYELGNINGWDGNKLYVDADNNQYLLAPQVGAGSKKNGLFTGVVMGIKKFNRTEDSDIGLFGYHGGVQSFFLDAKKGSATFGKSGAGQIIIDPSNNKAIIKSGNYSPTKTGMEIDLSEPSIKFGNGNFSVDEDGYLTAKGGGSIGGWVIGNNTLYSNVDATNGRITLSSDKSGKIYSHSHNTFKSDKNGFYLSSDGLSIGSKFSVTNTGVLKATDGNFTNGKFSGEITATKGKIGGWFIDDDTLTSSGKKDEKITLDAKNGEITGPGFTLDKNGLKVEGGTKSTSSLTWGSNFKVDTGGKLSAAGCEFTCKGSTSYANYYFRFNDRKVGNKEDKNPAVSGLNVGSYGINMQSSALWNVGEIESALNNGKHAVWKIGTERGGSQYGWDLTAMAVMTGDFQFGVAASDSEALSGIIRQIVMSGDIKNDRINIKGGINIEDRLYAGGQPGLGGKLTISGTELFFQNGILVKVGSA